jgi:hypothetical protein
MSTGSTSFPVAQQTTFPYNYFYIRDPADTTNEICMVILGGSNTTTWSVIRGINGATVAHASGATWVQVIAPYTLQNFKQAPGAGVSSVTLNTSTTETVIATYTPVTSDIVAGASFEAIAFGTFGKVQGGALPTLQWKLYWGGSGSVGGAFTSTGSTALSTLLTGTSAPALLTTTTTGLTFDVNGTLTLISTTSATANLNWWYNNAASLATAASNAVTAQTATTISGAGPIILTAKWSASSASNTLTVSAPLIYRTA